jgi:hypothetical protein
MEYRAAIERNQRLAPGIAAGLVAALSGVLIWALLTWLINFENVWMAVGVGIAIGYAVRAAGKGVDRVFGLVGAALALGAGLFGTLLATCLVAARQQGVSFFSLLSALTPSAAASLLKETFGLLDLMFLVIAAYEGYRFSFADFSDKPAAKRDQ